MRLRNLLITIPLVLEGCASLPPPPQGYTCVLNVPAGYGICEAISTAVARKHVSPHDSSNKIPISSMDNWVAFDYRTWSEIEKYILELKDRATQSCQ